MAAAVESTATARDCLGKALKDQAFADSPFGHVFLGRLLLLKEGKLEDARKEYEQAVFLAGARGSRAALFYVREAYAADLFRAWKLDLCVEEAKKCLASDYPVERAYALAQAILYYWALSERAQALLAYTELKLLLPSVTAERDLEWQARRLNQAKETLGWFEGAQAEEPLMNLALDVEALDVDYKRDDFEGALRRLGPWVERYPIKDFSSWEPALKAWAGMANYNFHAATLRAGRAAEAEAGFREILRHVPSEGVFKGGVAACWGWLGYALEAQGRLEDAKKALEEALRLDAEGAEGAGLPTDPRQRVIYNGHLDKAVRTAFVESYLGLLEGSKE